MTATNNSLKPGSLNSFFEEFKKQSISPPGNDIVIKSCYEALSVLINNPRIAFVFKEVLTQRRLTPSHFVNLFFRAVQYIEIFYLKNVNYPAEYKNREIWEQELKLIFSKYRKLITEILLTKDTTTTIYQRYAGSKIVLNAFFPKKKLAVADFGCGGNYGLPGFEKNIGFSNIIDKTAHSFASFFLNQPFYLKNGLAIDKENPEEPTSKAWRLACSFYPQELSKNSNISILEAKITGVKKVKFIQKDLTLNTIEDSSLTENSYDAVIISTFLYQLNAPEQLLVLTLAKRLLKKGGLIVIQDFAIVDKNGNLKLINNWFSKPYSYKTFILGNVTNWQPKEILKWKNGRCKEVKSGKDFNYLLKYSKIVNAVI